MTETEWLACSDPLHLLDFLKKSDHRSDRKFRLLAVACSRRIWDFIDLSGRKAVETAELFADGRTGAEELRAARLACKSAGGRCVWYAAVSDPAIAARNTMLSIQSGAATEHLAQVSLIRDLFGPLPFRSINLDPAWLTPTVLGLATFIYAEGAFERLPDLATILEDRGCCDQDILEHCRNPGPHCKGCWVIDQFLGKK